MKRRKPKEEFLADAINCLDQALDERDEWMRRALLAEHALQLAAREIAQMRLDAQGIPDFPLTVHSLN